MARNFIDRCFEAVAPVHAVRRSAARTALQFLNSGYGNYGANLTKKSMRGWEYHGGSSKEDIEDNIDVLRQRSRDAYMGVPVAASALKTLRTNVVAGGLMPAPQIDGAFLGLSAEQTEELQEKIIREFSLWADTPECDMDGLGNFYKLQQLAYLGYLMNGDAFAALPMCEQVGQPYGLRVRVMEADRICSPDGYDRLAPCTVRGYEVHNIVQGVETNAEGRVVAYWVCNRHPLSDTSMLGSGLEWTRVEARGELTGRRNIVHVITRERAGQLRGVPVLAPVLEALKQLGRYTEAEINAAVISAMFTVFVQPATATDDRPFGEMLPENMLIDAEDQGSVELGNGASRTCQVHLRGREAGKQYVCDGALRGRADGKRHHQHRAGTKQPESHEDLYPGPQHADTTDHRTNLQDVGGPGPVRHRCGPANEHGHPA